MLLPRTTGATVVRDLDWFFRRDGSMFPVSYTSVPIEMAQGRGAVVAFNDIESRLQADEELRKRDVHLAQEQSSLRRLAALVAGGADSVEVFGAALAALVAKTGGPTSIEDFANLPADGVVAAVDTDIRCGAAAPIMVDGSFWGLIATGSAGPEPLAPDIEDRLSGFTELVATAILTTQAR
jgi:hypothetical protein